MLVLLIVVLKYLERDHKGRAEWTASAKNGCQQKTTVTLAVKIRGKRIMPAEFEAENRCGFWNDIQHAFVCGQYEEQLRIEFRKNCYSEKHVHENTIE